jgi:hypothetical protein
VDQPKQWQKRRPPQVSVLMPVRNADEWLQEALASVAAQTLDDWELLAVDDHSSDASRSVLEAAAGRDSRILLVANPGHGIVDALNCGLQLARAPLIARMDADDCCLPTRLAEQQRALRDNPRLFAVGCAVEAFPGDRMNDGMRRYLDWQGSLTTTAELGRDRFVECPVLHPTLMLHGQRLRELGGWCSRGWPEDWDLVLRALAAGYELASLPGLLYRWRLHDGQSWRNDEAYSEEAFARARAYFLAGWLGEAAREEQECWLLGAGPVGKTLARGLAREGRCPRGFAEVDPRKQGGSVLVEGRRVPVISMQELALLEPRPLAVAAVGQAGARERIRAWVSERGWTDGVDFIAAA